MYEALRTGTQTAMDDPLNVLGLGPDASVDEIKAAFRRLVKKCHPDMASGDATALKHFLRLKEAYQDLLQLHTACVVSRGKQGVHEENSFKYSGIQTLFFLEVDARDALKGVKLQVTVPEKEEFCHACNGLGKVPDSSSSPCKACNGRGYQEIEWGEELLQVVCNHCSGKGTLGLTVCKACRGQGQILTEKQVTVTIPPGISDGAIIKLPMQGPWDRELERRQDLFFEISVKWPEQFSLKGRDIFSVLKIDCWTALSGGRVQATVLDGVRSIDIPAGTGPGSEIRIERHGWIDDSGNRGDHIFKVELEMPSGPCPDDARRLLERLKEIWPIQDLDPAGVLPG